MVPLYAENVNLGWRITRNIETSRGWDMVGAGSAQPVYHELTHALAGFQIRTAAPVKDESPSLQTASVLGVTEIEANAGLRGKSRTARLGNDENMRTTRTNNNPNSRSFGKLLPAEDAVERAQEKVRLWPHPAPGRGDRAVRVYPRTSKAASTR